MRTKSILILFFLMILIPVLGQKSGPAKGNNHHHHYFRAIPDNSLYVELLGNAFDLGSLNYERVILHRDFFYLAGRIGFGYGIAKPGESYKAVLYSVPVLINGLFQLSDSFLFELGLGSNLSYASWSAYHPTWIVIGTPHNAGSQFCPFITVTAGIRVQTENGFVFRLGFTPLIQVTTLYAGSKVIYPWGGISFGYSF